jgi:outer membrane protein TolC
MVYRLPDTAPPDMQHANERATIAAGSGNNPVQQAQLLVPLDEQSAAPRIGPANTDPPGPEALPEPLPSPVQEAVGQETYPIDLSTALALAGANNLQIAFAAERVREAAARVDQADVLLVPSLNAGLVYNNHSGRIQDTRGDVFDVNRNSLFVGAGAVTGLSATAGGSGGPARLVVDLPLVDVLFEPLAARQLVRAAAADEGATFNNTLLEVSFDYLNLLQAHVQVAIAQEAVKNAEELAKLTEDFARAGEGLEADAERAQAELSDRRNDVLRAKESVAVASAELVRLLRLDPAVVLVPADSQIGPIDVVDGDIPLRDLIGQALAARPEDDRQEALVEETWLRLRQEQWRPWTPHLYAGVSGGGFGGAAGGDVKSFSDRTDFDVAAVWEWQNLGFGNAARQREQQSAHVEAHIAADQIRDLVASEVSRTYHQVQLRREQIDVARGQVRAASRALSLNFDGIRGKVLRPIEAQQAISALARARQQYLAAVLDQNRAQFELLRALGLPPGVTPEGTAAP